MHNPATALIELFDSWKKGQTPYHARDMGNSGMRHHIDAMRHITDCNKILDIAETQGKKVAVHRRAMMLAGQAVLNFPYNWGGADTSKPFTDHLRDSVEGVESFISTMNYSSLNATVSTVRSALDQVIELLRRDTTLNADIRGHVYRTVQVLRQYIDDEEFVAGADFSEALYNLWIATNAAAGASTDEDLRKSWRERSSDFWRETRGGLAASIPANAIALSQLAIAVQSVSGG
ncbi:hypothetical protein [Glutamicibacter sp. MCAF14]|uniref:hypothetical protein n=1 Tax=Glutamicibacter sp. MCAF14 TaxID=3233043 RepID=UPI003F8EF04B